MFLILVTTKVQLSLLLHLINIKIQTAFYMLMYKISVVCILLIYLSLSNKLPKYKTWIIFYKHSKFYIFSKHIPLQPPQHTLQKKTD